MLPPGAGCGALLLNLLELCAGCPAPVLSPGSVASCCIASVLSSQQPQCCLPALASALLVTEGSSNSASSPTMVQRSQDQNPAPSSQLLQAPQALQEVLQATPVAKRAAKWLYIGPRRIAIKLGPKVVSYKTVSLEAGYVSPGEGAAPLASPPLSGSDSGDTPQPQVCICPACSVVSSLRTVGGPAPVQHTLTGQPLRGAALVQALC